MDITITHITHLFWRSTKGTNKFKLPKGNERKNRRKFTEKNINRPDRKIIGRTLSTASTSFENRFKIRPNGVISNRVMGQWNTCFSINSCISFAEYMKPIDSVIDDVNTKIAVCEYKDEGKKKLWWDYFWKLTDSMLIWLRDCIKSSTGQIEGFFGFFCKSLYVPLTKMRFL